MGSGDGRRVGALSLHRAYRGGATLASLAVIVAAPLAIASRRPPGSVFVATVADGTTNAPIADADVSVTDLSRSGRTNWIGEAVIGGLSSGTHHVRVRRLGYVEAELNVSFDRDTVGVFFLLSPRPQSMDAVRTIAKTLPNLRMGEFEARRRMGIGRFLTDSILRADSTQPLAIILERRIPGLVSVNQGRTVARRTPGFDRRDCSGFDVYIDGERASTPAYSLSKLASRIPAPDETDLRFFAGRDVAGVEYYTDVEAPAQYRHQTMACGVLLIWLRY
jgi:hypothetical protein